MSEVLLRLTRAEAETCVSALAALDAHAGRQAMATHDRIEAVSERLVAALAHIRRDALVEALADLEHQQWAHWTRYMLDNLSPEHVGRWKRQCATPYADLTEAEKESDREWARKVLALIPPPAAATPPPRPDCDMCQGERTKLLYENGVASPTWCAKCEAEGRLPPRRQPTRDPARPIG